MCTNVSTSGTARVRSGGSRSTRFLDLINVELIAYNYIIYPNVGIKS